MFCEREVSESEAGAAGHSAVAANAGRNNFAQIDFMGCLQKCDWITRREQSFCHKYAKIGQLCGLNRFTGKKFLGSFCRYLEKTSRETPSVNISEFGLY